MDPAITTPIFPMENCTCSGDVEFDITKEYWNTFADPSHLECESDETLWVVIFAMFMSSGVLFIISIAVNSLFFQKKKLDKERAQLLAIFQQNGIDDSHKLWDDVADWQYYDT